jgi:glutaminyl-tRNA synthetase
MSETTVETTEKPTHFIKQIIKEDLAAGKHDAIVTRFPPEPNGFLHIGHAKSICLNFGLVEEFPGQCYLRFDDTNPIKEEDRFEQGIIEDIRWLGFDWGEHLYHTSDYYQQIYDYAVVLIKQGDAYVDSLTGDEIREHRGTLQQPGRESRFRDRSVDENLDLFQRMKAGEFKDGEHVLRAKIDMASGNLNLRDPIIYRIRHATHQRTGDDWCIYPMYDFGHPLSDAIEAVTHSLCSLEFQDHRPLYDWVIEHCKTPAKPVQTEFARLNVSHTIASKRKLAQLVEEQHVEGWDDPRMPTFRGMRHRGYPAAAIRHFCEMIGISKSDSVIDMSVLENCVRDELNVTAPRAMCVLDPIKVTIDNFPEGEVQTLSSSNHPQNEAMGRRDIPFSRTLYIERDDFLEEPPKKFFRLSPGKEVRLRNAYVIMCNEVIKDEAGNVVELRCSYDPDTLGKKPEGRKVKGVIHWVSAEHAQKAEVRLYDRLFTVENPGAEDDFTQYLNSDSLQVINECWIEPSLATTEPGNAYQFERLGYFSTGPKSTADKIIFNRVVGLRDTWSDKA